MQRDRVRWLGLGAAILMVSAGGCTSFESAVADFDAVTRRGGQTEEPQQIDYDFAPRMMPWFVRKLSGTFVDRVLTSMFTVEPTPVQVENPVGLARDAIEVLAEKAGDRLDRIALATDRLLWVLEFGGGQPLNQRIAIRGLADFAHRLGIDPTRVPPPEPDAMPADDVQRWLATIEKLWPPERAGALTPEQRASYSSAVAALVKGPLPGTRDQRALVGLLGRALQLENDPELVPKVRDALLAALADAISLGLRAALFAPSPRVREASMQAFYRLGGPPALAWLLAVVSDPPSRSRPGGARFDDDSFVRLRLARMCGQLGGDDARRHVGTGPAPIEYLYETAISDEDDGLRLVALEALARSLRRPVDFDPAWAEQWWHDEYVPRRGGGGAP